MMPQWIASIVNGLRGLAQLRHPALVRHLGAMRMEAEEWEEVCRQNPGAKIERGVIIKDWRPGQLTVAAGASVCRGTVLSCGDAANGHGRIAVGAGTWIGQCNNLRACAAADILIGRNCLVSQFCTLVSSNHSMRPGVPIKDQPADPRRLGIAVGDDVWLGAGVTVLPGVTIGNGAVIGANSVVIQDVPVGEIWAGSPARLIGRRNG